MLTTSQCLCMYVLKEMLEIVSDLRKFVQMMKINGVWKDNGNRLIFKWLCCIFF